MQGVSQKYSAFSIIEVLVGIFVFSLGLVSIYALLAASLSINERNKNSIIASNLAREQIELVRNIRDTNYEKLKIWNQVDPFDTQNFSYNVDIFGTGSTAGYEGNFYTLENNFSGSGFPIKVDKLISFKEGRNNLISSEMTSYKLCLNDKNIYTYDCPVVLPPSYTETPFYRYLYVTDKLANPDGTDSATALPEGALRIVSKVIWYKRGYYEFDIQTIITDWRRI